MEGIPVKNKIESANKKIKIVKDVVVFALPYVGKLAKDQASKVKAIAGPIISRRLSAKENPIEIATIVPLATAAIPQIKEEPIVVEIAKKEPKTPSKIVPAAFVAVAIAGGVILGIVAVGKIIGAIRKQDNEEEANEEYAEVEPTTPEDEEEVERAIFTAIANKIA